MNDAEYNKWLEEAEEIAEQLKSWSSSSVPYALMGRTAGYIKALVRLVKNNDNIIARFIKEQQDSREAMTKLLFKHMLESYVVGGTVSKEIDDFVTKLFDLRENNLKKEGDAK